MGHFEGKSKQYKEGWVAQCEGYPLHRCPYADDNATSAQPDDA